MVTLGIRLNGKAVYQAKWINMSMRLKAYICIPD